MSSSITTPILERLPFEILWHIFSFVSPRERSIARQVSKQLRTLCSHPIFWQKIELNHSSLWSLDDLRTILTPHLDHIRSISIQGVRDDTVRYLLNHCSNLQELRVRRWRTLSDHALKLNQPHKKLRLIALHGQETPYTAIDANALARLMIQLPNLQTLDMVAHAHIHIPTLLKMIQKHPPKTLRSITMPIYHHEQQYDGLSIATDDVEKLLETCPLLEQVFFVPNIGVYCQQVTHHHKLSPMLVHHRQRIIHSI
ncbi:hypothetical protein BDA99DRAFT_530453 [Phascolomyces articulosus]|uniref:F-box domain-containing protein n=1 Tax=Phascolomyces articulosus TaxID=60185 RepID=A0AAD5JKD9_9FUNG|nr:hypothetical protein BDA99DRAFT_530453 [Phascolomyces articulosus]